MLVLQCRDDGLLDLDDPVGKHLPGDRLRRGHGAVAAGARLAGCRASRSGPWWERSPGVGGRGAAGRERRVRRRVRAGGALPLQQPRLRPARRAGGPAARPAVVRAGGGAGARSARDDADVVPARRSRTRRAAASTTSRARSTEEPLHDTGAMAPAGPAVEHGGGPRALRRVPGARQPRGALPTRPWPRCAQPVPPAAGVRARRPPAAVRRRHARRATPDRCRASRPPCSPTRSTSVGVVALTNATTGFSGPELALALLARAHARPDARRGCPRRRCRTGRRSCSATGTGATPPTSCAGTTSVSSGATSPAEPSRSSSACRDGRIVGVGRLPPRRDAARRTPRRRVRRPPRVRHLRLHPGAVPRRRLNASAQSDVPSRGRWLKSPA